MLADQAPPKIAVVDRGFHDIDDLRPNLGAIREFADPADTLNHGNAVASLIGAVGDNHIGITGMMWNADLNLFDVNRPTHGPGDVRWNEAIVRAINSGARVINISWGFDESRFENGLHAVTPGDRQAVEDFRIILTKAIEKSRDSVTHQLKSLFVVAAGNHGGDADEAGWPGFVDDPMYRDYVIAVGYTLRIGRSQQRLAADSKSGHLVEIAAPGEGITSLDPQGKPVPVYGSPLQRRLSPELPGCCLHLIQL